MAEKTGLHGGWFYLTDYLRFQVRMASQTRMVETQWRHGPKEPWTTGEIFPAQGYEWDLWQALTAKEQT